ncbi:MAG: plastocyanin/azurin family copper-binding protein [Candidatus Nitrosomaritimum yanchengensis]
MKKKLIAIGSIISLASIVVAVIISSIFSNLPEKENESETILPKADVVMPTKVSRPGCEKTNHCYVPSEIMITKGESVTWVNEDAAFHSVTSGFYNAPTGLFDSGYLDPYQSFSFTFDETGTYDYYCTLHPWMEGQVIVD